MRWCHFPGFFVCWVVLDEKKSPQQGHLKRHIRVSLPLFFVLFWIQNGREDEDFEGRKRNNTGVFFFAFDLLRL